MTHSMLVARATSWLRRNGFKVAPTSYLKLYQREQHRRQHLESRVEAMQQEIDALKWRLHVARTAQTETGA